MSARGRTFIVIVGASLATTGCLYFTDLSGLSGAASPEASAGDGGNPDATTMRGDGAAEASADAGVGARPCEAGTHDFCIDFDDGKLDVPPWTAISRDGLLVVEDGPAVSSPKALHATLPARGNVSLVQRDRAFKSWTMAWRAVHVELDLLVKTPAWSDTDREMELVEISLTSDTNAAGAGLFVTKAGIVIMPSKAGEPPINGRAFPFETWTHVTYDIDASHFRVVVGDQVFEATHATSVAGPNAQLVGLFGLSSYSDPICAFDARYDNIVVDFK